MLEDTYKIITENKGGIVTYLERFLVTSRFGYASTDRKEDYGKLKILPKILFKILFCIHS